MRGAVQIAAIGTLAAFRLGAYKHDHGTERVTPHIVLTPPRRVLRLGLLHSHAAKSPLGAKRIRKRDVARRIVDPLERLPTLMSVAPKTQTTQSRTLGPYTENKAKT